MPIICLLSFLFPFILLPVIILLLFMEKDIRKKRIYCFLFMISIAFVLYEMIPRSSMDLFRYYEMMDIYSKIGFNDFLNQYYMNFEPLINLTFYIFSKFNDNHLIIIFTTIISYSILFYIIFDYQKKIKLNNGRFNIILFYFLSVFLIIYNITGIRFCLARLLFFLGLYLNLYKNKKNILVYLLYIIPIFLHQSAFLLLILRILLLINKNKIDYKLFIFLIIVLVFPTYTVNLFSSFFGNNAYLVSIIDKATKYVGYGNAFVNIYKLQLALTFFIIITIAIIKIKKINTNKIFLNYTILIIITCLGFMSSETISTRFIGVLSSFSFLIFMDLIKTLSKKNFLAFCMIIIPFCLFYLAFQFIQFFADGIFYNLIFDYKFTIIIIVTIFVSFIFYFFSKKESEA